MLEITPDHIAELADDDLRTLIGLLCEAELARHNLPVSAVTWGGNQRAADGGLDVRVALPAGSAVTDFVPRPNTGFQVKCQDMPRTGRSSLSSSRPRIYEVSVGNSKALAYPFLLLSAPPRVAGNGLAESFANLVNVTMPSRGKMRETSKPVRPDFVYSIAD